MSENPTNDRNLNRRIVVIVPDEPGALAQITEALGAAGINIESIDGRQAGELGIVSLKTDNDDAALQALISSGLRAIASDTILLRLPDRPGALAGVARIFSDHQLNVRTIHIVHRLEGHAIVAVNTDDDDLALSLLDSDSLI